MTNTPQKGITTAAAVVLIVAAGLLVFTGWYVLHIRNLSVATSQATDQAAAGSTAATTTNAPASSTGQSDVQRLKYSTAPRELQTAILNYTKSASPDCVSNGGLVNIDKQPSDPDVNYAGNGSAITPIGCDGATSTLFVRRPAGQWEMVEKTQFAFSCDTLKNNKVPVRLLKLQTGDNTAKCSNGTDLVDYSL